MNDKVKELVEWVAKEHGENMFKDPFYCEYVTEHDRESCRKWARQILSHPDLALIVKHQESWYFNGEEVVHETIEYIPLAPELKESKDGI